MTKHRIETLDWLRGIMALSIMFFHFTNALIVPQDASSILGRFGVYGVSIFFILSGLSIAIVYNKYISSVRRAVAFYVRRVFRIWPLLWVICILTVLPVLIATGHYSWKYFLINITTFFGFFRPSDYIAAGSWSIGNEMVYYALTPVVLLIYNYHKQAGNLLLLIATAVAMYFAFYLLDPHLPLGIPGQWKLYVHPFNNFFLYLTGIAIYYNFAHVQLKPRITLFLLVLAAIAFCFLPYSGNEICIVTGTGRILFVLISALVVFCFYKLVATPPTWISEPLEVFGMATYGVYLIHPVVFAYLRRLLEAMSLNSWIILYLLSVIITITLSVLSFKYFESAFISLGKKLTNKLQSGK